jgi:hypothetical protein
MMSLCKAEYGYSHLFVSLLLKQLLYLEYSERMGKTMVFQVVYTTTLNADDTNSIIISSSS